MSRQGRAKKASRKTRADIQSRIKGIPSNYDANILETMVPDTSESRQELAKKLAAIREKLAARQHTDSNN